MKAILKKIEKLGSGDEINDCLNENADVLIKKGAKLWESMEDLTPAKNTVILMHFANVLYAQATGDEFLYGFTLNLLESCNFAGAKSCIKSVCQLCGRISQDSFTFPDTIPQTLSVFRNLIDNIASENELLPIHMYFLKGCIFLKKYPLALNYTNKIYLFVDAKRTGIKPADAIVFFYYAGCVNLALKKYDKAIEFLDQALAAPCNVPHQAQVDAYKKLVLVGLKITGKIHPIPRHASNIVHRFVKELANNYVTLAQLYQKRDQAAMEKFIEEHAEDWKTDENAGLIKQVKLDFEKQGLKNLTNTYLRLSLSDISRMTKIPEDKVESLLFTMVCDGEIYAQIDKKTKVVNFEEPPQDHSAKWCKKLEGLTGQVLEMIGKSEDFIEHLEVDFEYLKRMVIMENAELMI